MTLSHFKNIHYYAQYYHVHCLCSGEGATYTHRPPWVHPVFQGGLYSSFLSLAFLPVFRSVLWCRLRYLRINEFFFVFNPFIFPYHMMFVQHDGSHKWSRSCSIFRNTLGHTPRFLAVLVFLNCLIFFVVVCVSLFV